MKGHGEMQGSVKSQWLARPEDIKHATRKQERNECRKLLALHKRYEDRAIRLFRRGITETNGENKDGIKLSKDNTQVNVSLKTDYLPKNKFLNDKDYLKELLEKKESGNYDDENNELNSQRPNSLRLPMLGEISPENKAIFYTTLPRVPSMAKTGKLKHALNQKKEPPRRIHWEEKSKKLIRHSRQCLTVKPLLSDQGELKDLQAITSVDSANCTMGYAVLPQIVGQTEEMLNETPADSAEEVQLWLVPYQPYRLSLEDIGRKQRPKAKSSTTARPKVKAGVNNRQSKSEESQRRRYKKSVHFSEFLHEVHLYSPALSRVGK